MDDCRTLLDVKSQEKKTRMGIVLHLKRLIPYRTQRPPDDSGRACLFSIDGQDGEWIREAE